MIPSTLTTSDRMQSTNKNAGYLLVNYHSELENSDFELICIFKIVIFRSYVSLLEGI